MGISKAVGSLFAVGLVVAAVGTTSTPAEADTDCAPAKVTCAGGKIHVVPTDAACTINGAAPWKWSENKDLKASFEGCNAENHCKAANIAATACSGKVTVFQCKATSCMAPVKLDVPH
jgi:hypothetical protein